MRNKTRGNRRRLTRRPSTDSRFALARLRVVSSTNGANVRHCRRRGRTCVEVNPWVVLLTFVWGYWWNTGERLYLSFLLKLSSKRASSLASTTNLVHLFSLAFFLQNHSVQLLHRDFSEQFPLLGAVTKNHETLPKRLSQQNLPALRHRGKPEDQNYCGWNATICYL